MCGTKTTCGTKIKTLVPKPSVSRVLFMAHSHQLGAHLAAEKTALARFFWTGGPRLLPQLCKLPEHFPKGLLPQPSHPNAHETVYETLSKTFSRIAMDVVGPLQLGTSVHTYPDMQAIHAT